MGITIQRVQDRQLILGGLGAVQVRHGKPGGGGGNGLLNNLIAFWPGNEAAGNLIDAHTNGLDLTDTNTVTSNPGHVYPLARQYTLANSEWHEKADDAFLSIGNIDFTIAAWVYLNSKGANRKIVTKGDNSLGNMEYHLQFYQAEDVIRFYSGYDAAHNRDIVNATNFGSPPLSTWFFVVCWRDIGSGLVGIQINNGIADTVAINFTQQDTDMPFAIGAWASGLPSLPWDGRIGPTAIWKSAVGGGGVLTAAQRTALYNAGTGLAYAAFTV